MRILLVLLLLALGLAGCATGPHRLAENSAAPCDIGEPVVDSAQDPPQRWERRRTGCSHAWAVRYAGIQGRHSVNYIEIDEQGVLRSRAAAEETLRYANTPGAGGKPVYLVVFIHGWHHDAAADDDNVQGFHNALASVSRWNPDREVRGVVIGWRGKAWSWYLVRYLTFWDRKNTSEEVGRGGLLEFLLRLELAVKGPANPQRDDNRLVLVGHSFGASVAFNALAHVFLERFLGAVHAPPQTTPKYRGYGDLVVLINPAIEAMRFMPFQSALMYYGADPKAPLQADFKNERVPRLVVLSSDGDWATHVAFPVARFPSTLLESHDTVSPAQSPDLQGTYSETFMDSLTLGNYQPFHTHARLEFAPGSAEEAARPGPQLEACTRLSGAAVRRLLSAPPPGVPVEDGMFPDSRLKLVPVPGTPYRPYLLAAVDTKVIKDHTDIGREPFMCWLDQLATAGP
jgi:pimeloyl-ACP methyl ester carboxylesterase